MAFGDTRRFTGLPMQPTAVDVNVSRPERWASALAGGAAIAYGLKERGIGGLATAAAGGALIYRGVTGHCPVYALFNYSTIRSDTRAALGGELGIRLTSSITINRPAEELYRFWRNFENLPQVMTHLKSVRSLGEDRSHWEARGPAGTPVEWNAVLINDIENKLIAWRSLDGSDLISAGSVHFDPRQGGSTQVTVILQYSVAPGGRLGTVIAGLLGDDPSKQIEEDLWRLKQTMEDKRLLIAPSPLAPITPE